MLQTLRNAWKIQELRKKILYTLFMLLIFRLGCVIPTPFVNVTTIQSLFETNGLLGMVDMFNGGTLSNFTIFATGISPYITASIVIQLLTVAIPALEKLQKEGGEDGRKKIAQYTRYGAIVLSIIQSIGYIVTFSSQTTGVLTDNSWYVYITIVLLQAAGAAFAMWIGERITEKGIGNGISLLIFINIVARLPVQFTSDILSEPIKTISELWTTPGLAVKWPALLALLATSALLLFGIVYVDLAIRRIPVQYAKRVVGRKMYGGQATHIPFKVNNSGVMPLIFAMTLINFPAMILQSFTAGTGWFNRFAAGYMTAMSSTTVLYNVVLALLVVGFTYFYSQIAFNPGDISKNIQQNGGMIPGIRQGKPTTDYLAKISNRLSLFSALFFTLLAIVPSLLKAFTGLNSPFGATSVLILVGVALETSKQLESQMLMRHYKGFLG
ncbi:MAG: preprotein translocase subunit SecY [Eubacteriales bacterium]|nr:preprotein translocase subunit SecY [Eubacteriales bacterium]